MEKPVKQVHLKVQKQIFTTPYKWEELPSTFLSIDIFEVTKVFVLQDVVLDIFMGVPFPLLDKFLRKKYTTFD